MTEGESAALRMEVTPPEFHCFVDDENKNTRVLWCDCEVDVTGQLKMRFDINVIFDSIELPISGFFSSRVWHVATTGGRCKITVKDAYAEKYTESHSIEMSHSLTEKRMRNTTLNIMPKITAKGGKVSAELSGLGVLREGKREYEYQTSLTTNEQMLTAKKFRNGIEWDLMKPETREAIRHYVYGNLFVFAEFTLAGESANAAIRLMPTDTRIFDERGNPLPDGFALSSLWYLWKKGIWSVGSVAKEQRISIKINKK